MEHEFFEVLIPNFCPYKVDNTIVFLKLLIGQYTKINSPHQVAIMIVRLLFAVKQGW